MKIQNRKVIDVYDWDDTVKQFYGKPYSFQQQEGCRDRGTFKFRVPNNNDDYTNDSLPEEVNHEEMGVSFEAWKARDPKQPLKDESPEDGQKDWMIEMWWERNFYPDIQTLANDLCKQGVLEAGDYTIDINW